ncbi:hypothetical protein GCM10023080_073780 [Streptomyces pseudoechinosporeus]
MTGVIPVTGGIRGPGHIGRLGQVQHFMGAALEEMRIACGDLLVVFQDLHQVRSLRAGRQVVDLVKLLHVQLGLGQFGAPAGQQGGQGRARWAGLPPRGPAGDGDDQEYVLQRPQCRLDLFARRADRGRHGEGRGGGVTHQVLQDSATELVQPDAGPRAVRHHIHAA